MKARPKVVSIVGARPQFIKLAPLTAAMRKRFRHTIIHTGQHYDHNMSELFFRQLRIPRPDVNLNIGGGSHGVMTGRMLPAIERPLIQHDPAVVLVYGDTNTTLAGALAASKLNLPVAHIEAGMRSFVKSMPEEINRRVADHLADLLFCPTEAAIENCRREGLYDRVVSSGDLMYELLHRSRARVRGNSTILRAFGVTSGEFLLMTVHRAGTVDDPERLTRLVEIIEALPLPTILPLHPRTKSRLRQQRLLNRLARVKHVRLTEPLGYFDNLTMVSNARVVLTDSGGLQKEAVFLRTPVLTLRDETEWPETLKRGNRLVGLDITRILRCLRSNLTTKATSYRIHGRRPSEIIVSALRRLAGD